MEITLNNQPITISDADTLESVLISNDLLDKKGIAVAVNHSVIQKVNWKHTKLNTNDKIMVITATAGG
jgi:sulfur carrier protein